MQEIEKKLFLRRYCHSGGIHIHVTRHVFTCLSKYLVIIFDFICRKKIYVGTLTSTAAYSSAENVKYLSSTVYFPFAVGIKFHELDN